MTSGHPLPYDVNCSILFTELPCRSGRRRPGRPGSTGWSSGGRPGGTFAGHHSLALQRTLYEMGSAVLAAQPQVAEVRFSAPNRHHVPDDLAGFGLENDNELFHADDRPYGLIEATVRRQGAPTRARPSTPGWAGDRADACRNRRFRRLVLG